LVYPQTLPHYKIDNDVVRAATLKLGQDKSREWLAYLDQHLIGPDNNYVCGDRISIADYFGSAYVTLGELIGIEFSDYPNVSRWLETMKALASWGLVNEALDGWAASIKGQPFTRLS
jgi:glutathione S-transferase